MAVIHSTTLKPTKAELLTAWLPSRPWYQGGAAEPRLAASGGFRLDDPRGEVGIEFIVVTDTSGTRPVSYLTPLTYRGAPLEGADDALVGTLEHGVLGQRWVYDGCHDPVLVAQLLALIEGRARAQDQHVSDTPAPQITRSCAGGVPAPAGFTAATDGAAATELTAPGRATLRLHRVLQPGSEAPGAPGAPAEEAAGFVSGPWHLPDGSRARGLFATLHGIRHV
ncbi:maltokinase N-terminal cap-like domain-containing protein [Streptomyces sp. URMC 124]|uniref:maltokinase N-terminal cap-like domain-containing protein n=1 Tax=Streptomyces sp. URMC 124 TaxID=3423405 RepID=UPI003F19EFD1